ncbi:MAG: hypothetical protein V4439_02085 [Patescibacteria group bacterium]
MKKTFSKILIPLIILSFFLAPMIGFPFKASALASEFTLTANPPSSTDTFVSLTASISNEIITPGTVLRIYFYPVGTILKKPNQDFPIPEEIIKSKKGFMTEKIINLPPGNYQTYAELFSDQGSLIYGTSNTASFTITSKEMQYSVPEFIPPTNVDGWRFDCSGLYLSPTNIKCVIASVLYDFIFTPLSDFARFSAGVLDKFIYYSTLSSSYSQSFVGKAWAAVRDISNIFFIIALLYVAIQTILGLGSKAKQMIATIIVVALIINFSLFFTEVIIDGSNILARVFYNHITSKNKNGKEITNAGGERSISLALASEFDPQKIVPSKKQFEDNLQGPFIFTTIMAIIIMLYMAYCFLSVSWLFLGRVCTLWMAMVFSPLAFASYVVPFDIAGFGHQKWWETFLKSAFLAPIYIFFLYVIILFGDAIRSVVGDFQNSTDWLDQIMYVAMPFAIVYFLLNKSKKLAEDYSGDMAGAVGKIAGIYTGLLSAVVFGGVGFAGRVGLGRVGNMVSESAWMKDLIGSQKKVKLMGMELNLQSWLGKRVRSGAETLEGASYDVRGLKIGGKDIAGHTGWDLGKPQEGGFKKMREEQGKKRRERSEKLSVGHDEEEHHMLEEMKVILQDLYSTGKPLTDACDNLIKLDTTRLNNAIKQKNPEKAEFYGDRVANANEIRRAAKGVYDFKGDYKHVDEMKYVVDPETHKGKLQKTGKRVQIQTGVTKYKTGELIEVKNAETGEMEMKEEEKLYAEAEFKSELEKNPEDYKFSKNKKYMKEVTEESPFKRINLSGDVLYKEFEKNEKGELLKDTAGDFIFTGKVSKTVSYLDPEKKIKAYAPLGMDPLEDESIVVQQGKIAQIGYQRKLGEAASATSDVAKIFNTVTSLGGDSIEEIENSRHATLSGAKLDKGGGH